MKKNVKYLGMAAAALLAVAPVATTGVANAAVSSDGTVPNTPANNSDKDNAYTINVNSTMAAQAEGTQVSSLTSNSAIASALGLTKGQIAGYGKSAVVKASDPSVGVSGSLTAGQYVLVTSVGIGGLEAGKDYTIKQGNSSFTKPANQNGIIENVTVTIPFNVYDANAQGQPYFKDMTAGGVNLQNGGFAYKAQTFTAGETVTQIEDAVKAAVVPMVNEDGTNRTLAYNFGNIKDQLANQGVSLTNNDTTISNSASSFYITVTTVNTKNNKTAVAKVQFNKAANQNVYPAIYQNSTLVKQGNSGAGIADVSAKKGSDTAKALAKDPISALGLKAYTINNNNSGQIDLKTLTNNINPNVSGIYPVTLRATNPNGYTTDVTFNVIITPDGARTATVQYKAGYGVNIWNVLSSTSVSFSGKRAMAGSTVTIYGEKTVNGVKYYQIGSKDSNEYIQAQYVDGTSSETTPSTNNGEESVSGVLTVRYDGKGKVGLTNAEGKYTGQYVSKNSRWKVFAKKTINGREFYRIGNQNQWIPAQYSELAD